MISLHEGKGHGARKPAERVCVLRVSVVGCLPKIWRRFLVRESMWLSRLHDCIQVGFDWFDYQTHVFFIDDGRYGNPARNEAGNIEDDRDITLSDLDFASRERIAYLYQFGDGWQVEVHVESVQPMEKNLHYPLCIAGERAGPPEDCGGLEAFHDMLECIKEPTTDLGREWTEWLGPDYVPERCDVEKINKALKKLK